MLELLAPGVVSPSVSFNGICIQSGATVGSLHRRVCRIHSSHSLHSPRARLSGEILPILDHWLVSILLRGYDSYILAVARGARCSDNKSLDFNYCRGFL